MIADGLTKPLTHAKFHEFIRQMRMGLEVRERKKMDPAKQPTPTSQLQVPSKRTGLRNDTYLPQSYGASHVAPANDNFKRISPANNVEPQQSSQIPQNNDKNLSDYIAHLPFGIIGSRDAKSGLVRLALMNGVKRK